MAHIQPLQHDTKPSASPLIARLNARIADVLTPHLPSTPFALVDFPDHANIGDSSIWLGTLSHFGRAGLGPAYVCTIETFDAEALIAAVPDGPIFIQGGGNFGDLWPENQNFRIRLLPLPRPPHHPAPAIHPFQRPRKHRRNQPGHRRPRQRRHVHTGPRKRRPRRQIL